MGFGYFLTELIVEVAEEGGEVGLFIDMDTDSVVGVDEVAGDLVG